MNKIPKEQWHPSMRGHFAGCLYNAMIDYKGIVLVVADLGYGAFDKIKEDFPDRFYNVGASEFSMVGIACGLALTGKVPFVYSITNFTLYRPFEIIRNYVNYESIPVKLIGSGRGKDYEHDGISHWSEDASNVLECFPNIIQYWPDTKEEMEKNLKEIIENDKPVFLSLKR